MTDDKIARDDLIGFAQDLIKLESENLELKHQIHELQLQVGDWQDVAEQTITAARGTMIDAAGERQLRQLVDSVIAYQKENAQLFEVNEQLADVIENFIAAQGTSKEDDAYTALCAYPKNLNKQSYE
jgi:lipopolysaccharide biosynthesis protein